MSLHRMASAVIAAGTIALLGLTMCGGESDEKTIMRARTGNSPDATRKCTDQEIAEIRTQIEVVKNYWALPYQDEYSLFSSSFRQILQDAHNVSSASDYAGVMASNERQWLKQTYKRAEIRNGKYGQVTVLVEWSETGYQGAQTVIFDMIKEDGTWKISSIFY